MWSNFTNKQNYRWDYQPLGRRRYVERNGTILLDVTSALDQQRIRDIESKTLLKIGEFRSAHCSGCPSDTCSGGYFRAVAPEVCGCSADPDAEVEEIERCIPEVCAEIVDEALTV